MHNSHGDMCDGVSKMSRTGKEKEPRKRQCGERTVTTATSIEIEILIQWKAICQRCLKLMRTKWIWCSLQPGTSSRTQHEPNISDYVHEIKFNYSFRMSLEYTSDSSACALAIVGADDARAVAARTTTNDAQSLTDSKSVFFLLGRPKA